MADEMMNRKKPEVSVIIPCLNEADNITAALDSLTRTFFNDQWEILVIDGGSTDGTPEMVREWGRRKKLNMRLIENPAVYQVHGLNIGIKKARGDILVRADAHCLYPPDYIGRCVGLLKKTKAANVGGVMRPLGRTDTQKAIALAMNHPLGVGDARFHLGNYQGFVDTVYLGTFWKRTVEALGGYDPRCRTNEDAELNLRIIEAGGLIYLDDRIEVVYFPRKSLRSLGRQYFRYGLGRAYTTLKHRRFTSLRQVLPPALIPVLVLSVSAGFFEPLFFLLPLLYFAAVSAAPLLWPRRKAPLIQRWKAGLAMIVMHLCWGAGFLRYMAAGKKIRSRL